MLRFALLFLVIALVAGVLGFTTAVGTAIFAARVLFGVFLVLFLATLLLGRSRPNELV